MSRIALASEFNSVLRALEGTVYATCATPDVEGVWIRIDTADSDPKEQWDNYLDHQAELAKLGFTIHDPQVEHDCISGDLHYVEEEDTDKAVNETHSKSPVVDSLYTRVLSAEMRKAREAGKSAVDLLDVDARIVKLTQVPILQLLDYIENTNAKD